MVALTSPDKTATVLSEDIAHDFFVCSHQTARFSRRSERKQS
jgi:hypothetical protein